MSTNTISQRSLRKYTTLDQLTVALEHSERDMLVVLDHGNETASVWPPGHPEGWSESCPRVFRVPTGMNGTTRQFVRDELNKRDGWAITGDEVRIPLDELLSFAVQQQLDLVPAESKRHRLWRTLKEHGPCTSTELAKHIDEPARIVSQQLYMAKHRGVVSAVEGPKSGNGMRMKIFSAAKEPPYEPASSTAIARNGHTEYEAMKMILAAIEHNPSTRREIQDITELRKKRLTTLLTKLKRMGLVAQGGMKGKPTWYLVKQ